MRRIGLLGGTSWESTAGYYRLLDEGVRDRLGGKHSADLLLRSFGVVIDPADPMLPVPALDSLTLHVNALLDAALEPLTTSLEEGAA